MSWLRRFLETKDQKYEDMDRGMSNAESLKAKVLPVRN
jgi:hypothetical protein